jgi:protein-S-isoprenylcysteine O-methyltransferase Ste14
LVVGLGLDALLPSASVPGSVAWPVGAGLLVAGLALMWSFVAAFRRARTDINPGKPTTAIATDGPYRYSRNPGYLGMAFAYAGIAVLAGAPWAFVPLIPTLIIIDRGVVAREERYLEGKFGSQYVRYKARARRWL